MKKKLLIAVAAITLIIACVAGGSLAYLFTETNSIVNTFEYGDINITLTESENLDLKMIPGNDITKDPEVTVLKDSEACWLFIKIEESTNFDDFMSYEIADGWNPLSNEPGVYYREVAETTANTKYSVLESNKVSVNAEVTKTMLNAFDADQNGSLSETEKEALPKLTFTAYAVQKANVATAADAWTIANS